MGQRVGYNLDFRFLDSALFLLEKNETENFYVFKVVIDLKIPNFILTFVGL